MFRMRRYFTIIAVILGLAAHPAFSQKLKLNTYLDTTTILIGDQIQYTIELEQPENIKVVFPNLKDTLAPKIEILASEPADTSRQGTNLIIRKKYTITSFDSGYYTIPAFQFPFRLNNQNDTLTSRELNLKVNTLPVDTAKEIMDIKPVMNTPFKISEIKHELILGLALAAILALIVWMIIRRKKDKPFFGPRKPQEPPHVIALREIDRLRSEQLWQNGQIKLYYTRLTDILRNYISGRYDINAMEMTTDEILFALSNELNTDTELKASFTNLLNQADMVKFAKAEPLPQENEVALLSAYTFVNRTKMEVFNNPLNVTSEQSEKE